MAFFVSGIFVMSLLLQSGLGLTPLQGGLKLRPFCIAAVVTRPRGPQAHRPLWRAVVIRAGCAISATGTTLLGVALAAQGGGIAIGWLVAGLGIIGAGNSLLLTAYLGATLSAVRPDQAGIASGTLNTIQQFAGSAASRSSARSSSPSWAITRDPDGTRAPPKSSSGSDLAWSPSWRH